MTATVAGLVWRQRAVSPLESTRPPFVCDQVPALVAASWAGCLWRTALKGFIRQFDVTANYLSDSDRSDARE